MVCWLVRNAHHQVVVADEQNQIAAITEYKASFYSKHAFFFALPSIININF